MLTEQEKQLKAVAKAIGPAGDIHFAIHLSSRTSTTTSGPHSTSSPSVDAFGDMSKYEGAGWYYYDGNYADGTPIELAREGRRQSALARSRIRRWGTSRGQVATTVTIQFH